MSRAPKTSALIRHVCESSASSPSTSTSKSDITKPYVPNHRLFPKTSRRLSYVWNRKTLYHSIHVCRRPKLLFLSTYVCETSGSLPLLRFSKPKTIIACSTPPRLPKHEWKRGMSENQKQNHNNIITCAERQSRRKNPVDVVYMSSRLPALHLPKTLRKLSMFLSSPGVKIIHQNETTESTCF